MTVEQMAALAAAGFTKDDILKFAGAEQPQIQSSPATSPVQPAQVLPSNGVEASSWDELKQAIVDLKQTVQASNLRNAGFDAPQVQSVEDILAEMIAPPGAPGAGGGNT